MDRHIEVANLAVVKIHDAVEVLLLVVGDVVVERHAADAGGRKVVGNMLDHATRLVDLVEIARRAADVFAVTGRDDDLH